VKYKLVVLLEIAKRINELCLKKKKSFGDRKGCAEIPGKQSYVAMKTLDVTRECLIRKEHLKLLNYSPVNVKIYSMPSRSIYNFPRLKLMDSSHIFLCCLGYENEISLPVFIFT
jgi:hypothetical protein